jgi:hypothetical protein
MYRQGRRQPQLVTQRDGVGIGSSEFGYLTRLMSTMEALPW